MPDREKVIRGLECCLSPNDHENCPYDGVGRTYSDCLKKLVTDALSLLKAQEPRVLTLAEAAEADVCWLEIEGSGRILPCMVQDDEENFSIRTDEPTPELGPGDENGKEYRLWSARPTDAQREAVKWG